MMASANTSEPTASAAVAAVLRRHWPKLAVFGGAYVLALTASWPLLHLPLLGSDEVTLVDNSATASWHDILVGNVSLDRPAATGRMFRPLVVVTWRFGSDLVATGGPGHRFISFGFIALLAVAAFWLVERLTGRLRGLPLLLAGLLTATLAASYAAIEPLALVTVRADVFTAIFVVLMVGAALDPVARIRWRRPRRALVVIAVAAFGLIVSKESGVPFVVATAVGLLLGLAVVRAASARWIVECALATAAGMVAAVTYKAVGGFDQLLVPSVRLGVLHTYWNIGPVDTVLRHVQGVDPGAVFAVSNGIKNVVGTVLPAFTPYGAFVNHRIPFLLPAVVLVAAVFVALRKDEAVRRVAMPIVFTAVVDAGAPYVGMRPRWLLPSYALWVVIVSVVLVALLRARPRLRGAAVVVVVAGALVGWAVAYEGIVEYTAYLFPQLYEPASTVGSQGSPGYEQRLAVQQRRYACELLPRYRSFLTTPSVVEHVTSVLAGEHIPRPPMDQPRLAAVTASCASRTEGH